MYTTVIEYLDKHEELMKAFRFHVHGAVETKKRYEKSTFLKRFYVWRNTHHVRKANQYLTKMNELEKMYFSEHFNWNIKGA